MGAYLRLHVPRLPFLPHLIRDIRELEILNSWKPKVLIAHCANQNLTKAVMKLGIPLINTSGGIDPTLGIPTVTMDQKDVGRITGRYLHDRGCPRCYLLGPADHQITLDRWQGLQECAGEHHLIDLHTFHIPDKISVSRTSKHYRKFETWYHATPHATGVIADDITLIRMCDYALRYQGKPLQHLALLSAHDYGAASLPRLSGVQAPVQEWAVKAVQAAMALAQGETLSPSPHYLKPIGIEERESTSTINTGDDYLTRALEIIQNRVEERTTVAEVAEEVGLVRRTLELRFRKHLGHTVLEEIHRVHTNRATMLLRETDFSIDEVVRKSGFTDREHLRRVFKKRGLPPPSTLRNHYRKQRDGG